MKYIALRDALKQRILVLDGAMGTSIQDRDLSNDDFGGEDQYGCNEYLVLTRPDVIRAIHTEFAEAGADILETNTFGGTPMVLGEFGLSDKAYEINKTAAQIAREVADRFDTPEKPRFVAGSVGPTTKAISLMPGISFTALEEEFYQQALGLIAGGVDFFLLETCQDTRNVKAAALGLQRAMDEAGVELPFAVSVTIEVMGTMLAGQTVEALCTSLSHLDLLYIGLNCATGPSQMAEYIRTLNELTSVPIACVPNAGLPDEDGHYLESPEAVAGVLDVYAQKGWLNLIGGCCGTTPAHVRKMVEMAEKRSPRSLDPKPQRSLLSGINFLEVTDDNRPYLVGERTNVIGSRKFKRLIKENQLDEAAELGWGQEKAGATVIDICLSDPERDEVDDVHTFYPEIIKRIKSPIMIDSTDAEATKEALTYCQGKAIINSINLEDGLERFEKIVPLARKYGAALVVGCIDDDPDQGMALTRQRKLEVAERSYKILTEDFDFPEEDIYWDALVFPCATGDANYVGSAVETVEGIRVLKEHYPKCKTILGVSNVSFGLPTAGREILNAVFLHHCVEAGLDLAIVNAAHYLKYAEIPADERQLCEDILWKGDDESIAAFAAFYRKKKTVPKATAQSDMTVDEFLASRVLEGTKEGLIKALESKLKEAAPLEIINGPLMAGMTEVGRLFGRNELIVAEVLQSAEVMKAAVAYLEPLMEKEDTVAKGKMLLATVKGDVHDIGKNLVDIIFSNNGYDVVNLGIKVLPETLIEETRKHKPDIIGLSGLLVKSAQQMTITAEQLRDAGINVPLLLGGAALTEKFINTRVAPNYDEMVLYAKDAMSGLAIANRIIDPAEAELLRQETNAKVKADISIKVEEAPVIIDTRRSDAVDIVTPPRVTDFERHKIMNTPLEQILPYLNLTMVFTKHLGFKGNFEKALAKGDPKAQELYQQLEEVKLIYRELCQPKAVYQNFHAASDGNTINVYNTSYSFLGSWEFPRQNRDDRLCLADYLLADTEDTPGDVLGMFVVTAGDGVMQRSMELKDNGEYLKSHMLQSLALNTAEAYAELLHSQLRARWGQPDSPDMTMKECFAARYSGKRYSFGYPACPDIEGQGLLWQLLKPEDIGCDLSEGFMMEPEASVSALVFHHPQAKYFAV